MRTVLARRAAAVVLAVAVTGLAACGDDGGSATTGDRPHIVVTTNILGDVVRNLVGDDADVDVVMPPGSNPHDFAPSAQQVAILRDADVVVVNGLGFEAGLVDTIDAAADDGVPVITATDAIEALPLDPGSGEAEEDDSTPTSSPTRSACGPPPSYIADQLAEQIPALDTTAERVRVAGYRDQLERAGRRGGRHARRRPRCPTACWSPTTRCSATSPTGTASRCSAPSSRAGPPWPSRARPTWPTWPTRSLRRGVPAIFAETSSPARLADALAAEGHDVEVVELYSESLGEPRQRRRHVHRHGPHRTPDGSRPRSPDWQALGGWSLVARPLRARVHAARLAGRDARGRRVVGGRHVGGAPRAQLPRRCAGPRRDPRHGPRGAVGLRPHASARC